MLKKLKTFILCLIAGTAVSLSAQAEVPPNIFTEIIDMLKHTANFSSIGTVCEKLAQRHINSRFSSKDFYTRSGIEYARHGVTLGELDIVVFTKRGDLPVLIAEVKCWSKEIKDQAIEKAEEQLERFQEALMDPEGLVLYKAENPEGLKLYELIRDKYDIRYFDIKKFKKMKTKTQYETYSQIFSETRQNSAIQFTHDFGFTINEVKKIRRTLVSLRKSFANFKLGKRNYRRLPHEDGPNALTLPPVPGQTCHALFAN